MSILTVAVFFTRFLTSWTIFFLNTNTKNKLLRVIILTIFEVYLVFFLHIPFVILEPFLMLLYRVIFHPKDTLPLRIYYTLFPIVLTSLISSVMIFFVLPFLTHQSELTVWKSAEMELFSYLCVIPVLNFVERIFNIENFSFDHYYLQTISKFLWITDILLSFYFFGFYFFESANAEDTSLFGISKILILLCFSIFLYLTSYLNAYSKTRAKRQIQEEENQHLLMLEAYNAYIEELYKKIRSFKHDYDNIILSLAGSIDRRDPKIIKEVYQEIVEKMEVTTHDNYSINLEEFSNINNSDLQIFFALKFHELRQKGFVCKFVNVRPISNLHLKTFDFLVLMAVFMDFATISGQGLDEPFLTIFCQEDANQNISIIVESQHNQMNTKDSTQRLEALEKLNLIIDSYQDKYHNISFERDKTVFTYKQTMNISITTFGEEIN